jgi:hypothetical protein
VVVVDPGVIEVSPELLAAIGGIIVALTGLLAAIGGFLVVLRSKVKEVHTLVNSHATDQAAQIAQLTNALSVAGVPIPLALPPTPTGIKPTGQKVPEKVVPEPIPPEKVPEMALDDDAEAGYSRLDVMIKVGVFFLVAVDTVVVLALLIYWPW